MIFRLNLLVPPGVLIFNVLSCSFLVISAVLFRGTTEGVPKNEGVDKSRKHFVSAFTDTRAAKVLFGRYEYRGAVRTAYTSQLSERRAHLPAGRSGRRCVLRYRRTRQGLLSKGRWEPSSFAAGWSRRHSWPYRFGGSRKTSNANL